MPDQKQSIILGAAVVAVLSTSYLGFINCLCCAGVVAGAMVAVWHYAETYQVTIQPGRGAMMGLTAAVLGLLVSLILDYVLIQMGIRADQAVLNFILDRFGENMPPDQYDQLVEQRDQPATLARHFTSGLLSVAVGALFGAIGGAVGASVFKRGGDAASAESSL